MQVLIRYTIRRGALEEHLRLCGVYDELVSASSSAIAADVQA